ncbi:MAG: SDR family oxidoreductase [Puniceicoccaceae bacterium]
MKGKRKLLILGCGYVGGAVAESRLAAGWEVWGVSRNPEVLGRLGARAGFHPVVAEVDGSGWHEAVPGDADAVLNCVSAAGGGVDGYRKSYLGGNRSLVEWARRAQPERILYTSSTTVYPFTDGREVFEEDAGGDLSETGRVILESERILLDDPAAGPRTTVLRLAGIYGPGRHHLLDSLRNGVETLPGRGDFFLNLIHLDDIVSAVERVIDCPAAAGRVYNVSDGHPPTKQELVAWLARRLGRPVPEFDPEAAGRRLRVNAAGDPPNRRIRIDRIHAETGWVPACANFESGYERILDGGWPNFFRSAS